MTQIYRCAWLVMPRPWDWVLYFDITGEMKLDQSSVQEILVAADMIQLKEVNLHSFGSGIYLKIDSDFLKFGGSYLNLKK